MSGGVPLAGLRQGWLPRLFWSVVAVEWMVVAALLTIVLMPAWHAPTRRELLASLCLGTDTTRYAAGYSESAWRNIRIGDPTTAVAAALGAPFERWSHHDEWWSYSRQRTGTDNFRQRKLRFDLQGHVIEKYEACYID